MHRFPSLPPQDLSKVIADNFYRVESYMRKAVQEFVRAIDPTLVERDDGTEDEFYVALYNCPPVRKAARSLAAFVAPFLLGMGHGGLLPTRATTVAVPLPRVLCRSTSARCVT